MYIFQAHLNDVHLTSHNQNQHHMSQGPMGWCDTKQAQRRKGMQNAQSCSCFSIRCSSVIHSFKTLKHTEHGTFYYTPRQVISNHAMQQCYFWSRQWLATHSGMKSLPKSVLNLHQKYPHCIESTTFLFWFIKAEWNIYVSKLRHNIIGSDNGLSPVWRGVIIWTNADLLLTGPFWDP